RATARGGSRSRCSPATTSTPAWSTARNPSCSRSTSSSRVDAGSGRADLDRARRRVFAFFLINYFAQGAVAIIFEPLDYLLKDRLHLTPGDASGFLAWMTFPLLFKPLFGLVADLT